MKRFKHSGILDKNIHEEEMELSLTWVTFSMKYAIARMSEHLMILYIAAMKNERLVRI